MSKRLLALPAQSVCPDGWRLPSDVDFKKLIAFVSGTEYTESFVSSDYAASVLKSTTGWSKNRVDAYGFGAQPYDRDFVAFWTSTANSWADWFGADMLAYW